MRKVELVEVLKERICEVLCDRCEKPVACTRQGADVKRFHFSSVSYQGGYDSPHVGDMTRVEIDLCEECLLWLVDQCPGARTVDFLDTWD